MPTPEPVILFVADAGPEVGGGHVMRCLTLAGALADRGATCAFLATPATAVLLDAFAAPGIERVPAPSGDLGAVAARAAAEAVGADLVVFDHYGLSARQHEAIAKSRPAVVIDELADRPLGADLVVDLDPEHGPGQYASLAPKAELLVGPAYALVRREFRDVRALSLAKRARGGPVERVLVSMGLTDVGGITAKVARAVLSRLPGRKLDVVLSETSRSYPDLAALVRTGAPLRLHARSHTMARLMLETDLGVGGGGGTTWERCTAGLPSLTVILADNQRPSALALEAAGATLTADVTSLYFGQALEEGLARLAGDPALRRSLAEEGARLCDGLGAERVADACLRLLH